VTSSTIELPVVPPERGKKGFTVRVHSWSSTVLYLSVFAGLSCGAGGVGLAAGQASSGQRHSTRFTDPPGQETEAVQRLIDRAKAALEAGGSTTTLLTDPSFLPAHEWPRFRKLVRDSAQPSPLTIVSPNEPGDPLIVTGRIVGRDGRPVPAAVLYVYQTSSKGWYSDRAAHVAAREGDRRHARLFGYVKTDAGGRFEVRTIRPGGYPDGNLPAHIHVEVERGGQPADSLITEIRFDDDRRLTAEERKRSQQEGFVIAKVTTESENHQRVEVEFRMR
jgi:protocatechuate 3,4-dioxygenase beta subunit